MDRRIFSGLIIWAGLSFVWVPAHAVEGPASVPLDGGPLGMLDFSAGADGYFYLQSGTSSNSNNSIVGDKAAGADLAAWMIGLKKSTGLVQFTVQLAEWKDVAVGISKPSEVNGDRFTTGPLRTAYITLAPTSDFKFSVGQVPSVEGYESVFPWNNSVGLVTAAFFVENSNSRGVQMDYSHGPLAGTVVFGDGYDTGVWNYIQFIGTDKIDTRNAVAFYGGIPLGVTGPNTFAYGEGGMSGGGANGNGGQGQLANVNSHMLGGWYIWTANGLSITPQLQFQWTDHQSKYATEFSGGVSDDIPKTTSNAVAALFGNYKFSESPWSIGGWLEYATSHGSGPQDTWFVAPNAELVGFAFAPAYQYKQLFARLNVGYVHLLNSGTPSAGYGDQGTGKNQVISTLEFALVY